METAKLLKKVGTDYKEYRLYIEPDVYKEIKMRAIVSGITINKIINKILENYIKENKVNLFK